MDKQVQKTVEQKVGGDVGKILGGAARVLTKVITVNQSEKVKGTIDYAVTIRRDGPIRLSVHHDRLRVAVPLSVRGHAGLTGDAAKALGLDRKNFKGAITALADCQFGLSQDWCPVISVRPDFDWREGAKVELVSKVWIDVRKQAEGPLRRKMEELARDLPGLVGCERIRELARRAWRSHEIALDTPSGEPVVLRVVPIRVGLSKLDLPEQGIRFSLLLGARAEVATGTAAGSVGAIGPLPNLTEIPSTSRAFALHVPLRLGYEDLSAAAVGALGGRVFRAETPAGQASLQIAGVEVYPTEDRGLAVGLRFQARFEDRPILSTKGTVFLVAEPEFDPVSQVFRLKNVSFTRWIDNELWNALSIFFEGPIREGLEERAVFDLKPQLAKIRSGLQGRLAAAGSHGLKLELNDAFVGLRAIHLAERSIDVVAGLEGSAAVVIADLGRAKRRDP